MIAWLALAVSVVSLIGCVIALLLCRYLMDCANDALEAVEVLLEDRDSQVVEF